jgi:hypothetical protein
MCAGNFSSDFGGGDTIVDCGVYNFNNSFATSFPFSLFLALIFSNA